MGDFGGDSLDSEILIGVLSFFFLGDLWGESKIYSKLEIKATFPTFLVCFGELYL